MFNWLISTAVSWFTRKASSKAKPYVTDIVGQLEDTACRLFECSDKRRSAAMEERAEAAKLLSEAQDDEDEAERATGIAQNLERLLGIDVRKAS